MATTSLEQNLRLFPILTPEQLTRAARHGKPRTCGAGEVLREAGVQVDSIFVVVKGHVELVQAAAAALS